MLFVVLGALLVLTALFAAAQSLTVANLQDGAAERQLLARALQDRDLLDLALAWRANRTYEGETSFDITLDGAKIRVVLRDVGGLVDLNAADPSLLDRLAAALELGDDALNSYRDWRRTPYRLQRVVDFLRVTGADPSLTQKLLTLATVHSGRPGIDPKTAPTDLLALLGPTRLPETLVSAPSNTNYQVLLLRGEEARPRLLGEIHFAPGAAHSRVLSLL